MIIQKNLEKHKIRESDISDLLINPNVQEILKNNPNLLQVKGDGVTRTSIMSSLYEFKLYGNSMDHKGQL